MHEEDARLSEARAAFVSWAALQAGAPRDVASLVTDAEESVDHTGLLSTDVQGRRAVWKSVPASSRSRITAPSIAIESVDAWEAEPRSLRETSDHIALCDVCRGEKKVRCAACGGAGKVICDACGGQRKVYGYAANRSRRLLNCTTCRGKGEIDCAHCRRGIVACAACAGEGRMQRWIEIETWRRSIAQSHPAWIARQLGWRDDPLSDEIDRDAFLILDIERPHRLAAADIGSVPAQWLDLLRATLLPGEHIARQRLRIARVPSSAVTYGLGADDDRVVFIGRRMTAPPFSDQTAFARRAARLRAVRWLLLVIAMLFTIFSLGRGLFYWSTPTLLSLVAFAAVLASIHGVVAEWTGLRRQTRLWLVAAASFLIVTIVLAVVARPHLDHAQRMIVGGQLDAADAELRALGSNTHASTWDDLRTARILHTAATRTHDGDLVSAATALEELSDRARDSREAIAAAKAIYPPLAQQRITQHDWSAAADAILGARRAGIREGEVEPLVESIRTAALDAASTASGESRADERLMKRRVAEAGLVAWERASDQWGTPPLIALRTAMARDVAAAEKAAKRRP